MKRMIALLLLMMCTLTACASGAPEAADPPETPPAETAPKEQAAAPESIEGTATFSQAAPEQLTYAVELETLADSAKAEDGTELAVRTYVLPRMSVEREDGTAVTEAATPEEETALAAAGTFNSQFESWAASDNFDEITSWAEEERVFRVESGLAWHPYSLELTCEVYQTDRLVSVRAEYYSNTGGAHPNTVLLAWNFDLTTGQFFAPELLASDGQAFSQAVLDVLLEQSRETAASYDLAPEEFFWANYAEILSGWSSYAVSFDETGMTVGFSPYELASYAAGAQIYHLDYDRIAGYLSGHGLTVLGLSAGEK